MTLENDSSNGPEMHHFSFGVAVCFAINYIIGSGFLTLPWAFSQTGPVLGVLVMAVFCFFSMQAIMFTLETMSRAELGAKMGMDVKNKGLYYKSVTENSVHSPELGAGVIREYDESTHSNSSVQKSYGSGAAKGDVSFHRGEVDEGDSFRHHDRRYHGGERHGHQVAVSDPEEEADRCVQIVELCKIFMGTTGQRVYTAFLVLYMYGTLWAYATVFANAFAAHVPAFSGEGSYYFYLVVFGCIVVPMSLMEFSEQVGVQVALTAFRILMLGIMIGTVLIARYHGDEEFGDLSGNESAGDEIHPEKLYLLLPIAGYAYIFHHSIPSLSQPLEDKSALPKMFGCALAICFVGYVLIATVVSSYFGSLSLPSSNLNWETYTGRMTEDGVMPTYAKIVGFFIVLFPALDVASAFPLNAFTLGNNMMSTYFGSQMRKYEKSRFHLNCFRALAAVPPIFGACFVSDLSHITGYTGLTGFGICFIFPPLLAYYSKARLDRAGLDSTTQYSNYLTSFPFQVNLCITGILLFIVVGIFQITDATGPAEE